ncbi:hypothetical protein N9L19_00460 [bacterium]|nr:hypothetical protein [bacterium]
MHEVRAANAVTVAGARRTARSRVSQGAQPSAALPETHVILRWVGEIPSSHDPRWVGGIAGCIKCGGLSRGRLDKAHLLAAACRGFFLEGSASRVRAFLPGRPPAPFESWPDERTAASARRAHISLRWELGIWRADQ